MTEQLRVPMASAAPPEEPAEKKPGQEDYEKGKEFFGQCEYGQAAASFHNALVTFEQTGDEAGVANACDRLGDVCAAGKDLEAACGHYLRAYEICRKANDSFSMLSLEKKLVRLYRERGEHDKALELYFVMLDVYQANNNPKGAVEALESMAEVYQEKGEKDKAVDALRTVASIHANFRHSRLAEQFEARADALEAAG